MTTRHLLRTNLKVRRRMAVVAFAFNISQVVMSDVVLDTTASTTPSQQVDQHGSTSQSLLVHFRLAILVTNINPLKVGIAAKNRGLSCTSFRSGTLHFIFDHRVEAPVQPNHSGAFLHFRLKGPQMLMLPLFQDRSRRTERSK